MKIEKIDHISFAVKDLEATKKTYREDLGLEPAYEYLAPLEKIKVARYFIGEVAVELMESTAPDGEVAKFIINHGALLPARSLMFIRLKNQSDRL